MKARVAKSKPRPGKASPRIVSAYAANRCAYLVTVYYSDGQPGISFVTLQVSHDNEAHRFADLAGAFEYLLRHVDSPRGKSGEP